MSGFDDREKSFEAKYAHDAEKLFRITARRNKLLGLWAAGLLGHEGEAAETYAKAVVASDFEEAGHEDVYRKVMGDFAAASVDVSEHVLRRQMNDLLDTARQQIEND